MQNQRDSAVSLEIKRFIQHVCSQTSGIYHPTVSLQSSNTVRKYWMYWWDYHMRRWKVNMGFPINDVELQWPKKSIIHGQKYVDTWSLHLSYAVLAASTLLTRLFHKTLEAGGRGSHSLSHNNISGQLHWYWAIRPGSQLVFQFIRKVLDGVFNTKLRKPFLCRPHFVHRGMGLSCWNRKELFGNLKHTYLKYHRRG